MKSNFMNKVRIGILFLRYLYPFIYLQSVNTTDNHKINRCIKVHVIRRKSINGFSFILIYYEVVSS